MFASHSLASDAWRGFFRSPIFLSLAAYTAIIIALIFPTLTLYMWSGHDQLFPVIRVYELCKSWRVNGPFHAPWQADWAFGYGYPFYTFYPPLGYYVAAFYHFIFGLDYGPATKMSFYSSLYLSGLLMYALVYVIGRREGWPRLSWWALAAATAFALTRYHLTDIFVRDALAECWAWPTFAGVLLGAEIGRRYPGPGVALIAVMYAGLMLSHNVIALYGTITIGCYVLLTTSETRWPLTVTAGGVLGAALAAFFWLPALALVKLTYASLTARVGLGAMITPPAALHLHAVYWQQHFIESLGKEGSIPGPDDAMGINLGIPVLIGVVLAVTALFQPGLRRDQRYRLGICLVFVVVFLFMMSPQMNWARIPPLLRYVQFPWRLLIFTAFFGCLATVMAAPVLDKWLHPLVWTIIAVLLAIPTLPCILNRPGLLTDWGSTDRVLRWYARKERERLYGGTDSEEYWPLSVKAPITDPKFLSSNPPPTNRLKVLRGEIVVENYRHEGSTYFYKYLATTDVLTQVAVVYFPGWEFRIDGQKRNDSVSMGDDGLINLKLPAGAHSAELKYVLSPIGRIAQKITYSGWAVWGVLTVTLALQRWKKPRQRRVPPQSSETRSTYAR